MSAATSLFGKKRRGPPGGDNHEKSHPACVIHLPRAVRPVPFQMSVTALPASSSDDEPTILIIDPLLFLPATLPGKSPSRSNEIRREMRLKYSTRIRGSRWIREISNLHHKVYLRERYVTRSCRERSCQSFVSRDPVAQ